MLLVTHAGMTVNLAHVAYIQSRSEEEPLNAPARPNKGEAPVRLLLVLAGGDSVVAARDLPPAACRSCARPLPMPGPKAHLTDVRDLLKRYAEGAYIAASAAETHPLLMCGAHPFVRLHRAFPLRLPLPAGGFFVRSPTRLLSFRHAATGIVATGGSCYGAAAAREEYPSALTPVHERGERETCA